MKLCARKLLSVGLSSVLAATALTGCSARDDASDGPEAGGASTTGGSGAEAGASAGASTAGAPTGGSSASGGVSTTAGVGGVAAGAGGGTQGGLGQGGATGGVAATACPADATFCSGFEEAGLPSGAVYKVNAAPGEWTRDFAIDTSVFRGGQSALRVKAGTEAGTSGSAYQMLAVPAPPGAFWVRLYIRQDELDIGGVGHNVFAGAADSDEPNSGVMVELAEDVGLAFNTKDDVRWPLGYGRLMGAEMPFVLAKGQWHCVELSFDGDKRQQQAFVAGKLEIDATNYPATVPAQLNTFKLGFNKLHGPARAVWYDDVAVGPTRPGCL